MLFMMQSVVDFARLIFCSISTQTSFYSQSRKSPCSRTFQHSFPLFPFFRIHKVVRKGIHITKRDLFYTDVKLFEKQNEVSESYAKTKHFLGEIKDPLFDFRNGFLTFRNTISFSILNQSDGVLDDVACMIGCTRTSLNVVASDKVKETKIVLFVG